MTETINILGKEYNISTTTEFYVSHVDDENILIERFEEIKKLSNLRKLLLFNNNNSL